KPVVGGCPPAPAPHAQPWRAPQGAPPTRRGRDPSKCLPKGHEPRRQPFVIATVHLEAKIHANRADWRLVPEPETDRRSKLAQVDVHDTLEDVAGVHESDDLKAPSERQTRLAHEENQAVATEWEPARVDRVVGLGRDVPDTELIEGEPAHGRIAARIKTFAS